MDDLARLQAHGPERDRRTGGRRVAGLLLELATGDGQQLLGLGLAVVRLPLRDRPRPDVLGRPERPTGMREEHLDRVAVAAKQQDPSRQLAHVGRVGE